MPSGQCPQSWTVVSIHTQGPKAWRYPQEIYISPYHLDMTTSDVSKPETIINRPLLNRPRLADWTKNMP